jgi:hypothetical protein
MGYDGGEDVEIYPNNPLKGFGPTMCSLLSMCGPLDQGCIGGMCTPTKNTCSLTSTPACKLTTTRNIYIIHIVDWTAPPDVCTFDDKGKQTCTTVTNISYAKSQWYFYKTDKLGNFQILIPKINPTDGSYTLPDIYDVDNGFVISVSRLTTTRTETNLKAPDITYIPTVTLNTATWLAGLETLAGGFTGLSIGATAKPAAAAGNAGAPPPVPQFFKARIKIQQLSVSNIQRPYSISIAATAAGQNSTTLSCQALSNPAQCSFQASVPVLQRSFISFGVNIVPDGPTEAMWAIPTGSTTETPTVSHHNAFYGVVDFTPLPVQWPMYKRPYFQGGLPFSGKAGHLPYFGAAYPVSIPWVQKNLPFSLFAGMVFMKQQGPHATTDRVTRLMWGFEVPIASFTKDQSGYG